MKLFVLSVLLVSWATIAYGQSEVNVDEVIRRGDQVTYSGNPPMYAEQQAQEVADAMAAPANDSQSWFLTVLTTKGCQPCEKLKADLATNPVLSSLVTPDPQTKIPWAHLNIYTAGESTQDWRGYIQNIRQFPTIVIQPPRTGRFGEPTSIVYSQPYNGDPVSTYKAMMKAVEDYVAGRMPTPTPTPSPQPYTPPPLPAPINPQPFPIVPVPSPIVPVVPTPTPTPTPTPAPVVIAGVNPEIIVVQRTQSGPLEGIKRLAVEKLATYVGEKYGADIRNKTMDLEEARRLGYPVDEDDMPCILLVRPNGRVSTKISSDSADLFVNNPWNLVSLAIGLVSAAGTLVFAKLTGKKPASTPTA